MSPSGGMECHYSWPQDCHVLCSYDQLEMSGIERKFGALRSPNRSPIENFVKSHVCVFTNLQTTVTVSRTDRGEKINSKVWIC